MQSMKRIRPYLKFALLLLFIVTCFRSGVDQLSDARELTDTDGAFFVKWEQRFDPIKNDLPFKYGVIGYVADWDLPGIDYDPADTEAEHVLTQYTMAPIVVSRDTSNEWILVNLTAAEFDTWFSMQMGEFTVTDYKHNLYLVHRIQ